MLDQVGVRLGREFNPGDFITLPSFLGEEGKRKGVQAVDVPAGTENVEHIKDSINIDSGRGWCLGDARSSPAPGVVAYRCTRWESRGGREGTCNILGMVVVRGQEGAWNNGVPNKKAGSCDPIST